MCTVQSCAHVATFVFSGRSDRESGGRRIVEAFCLQHAEETAVQIGQQWPIQKPVRESEAGRSRVFRAG